ncbi:hypothetical protein OF83DRAFT_1158714 [Amylostereum chailletii]|nr:hypothetical protein OF83DRAFT_1158714 [Amylostereum chailletii]
MPEQPEVAAWNYRVQRWIRNVRSKTGLHPKGRLIILPRDFALGTEKKSYTTCTVDRHAYTDNLEPVSPSHFVNGWDAQRSRREPFQYLLKPLAEGDVLCAARGKQLALAAGYLWPRGSYDTVHSRGF